MVQACMPPPDKPAVARVATDAAIGRTFDYAIPPALAASVDAGKIEEADASALGPILDSVLGEPSK